MSILDAIRIYVPKKWEVKSERSFTMEEMEAIDKAEVVSSDYGNSVCLFLKSGGRGYIPVSQNCNSNVGDAVDLNSAKLLTLSREGDADIYRIEF